MKNKKALFLGLLLAVSSLSGCKGIKLKAHINIGTKLTEIKELKREVDLLSLLSSNIGEGVLLATYSRSMSTGCACWTGFKEEILNKYVKNHNVPIYYFNTDIMSDSTIKQYNIRRLNSSDPMFYTFQKGCLISEFKYNDKTISSYKAFETYMNDGIVRPEKFSMFYVDENYLFGSGKNHISDEKSIVLTERNGCSDCSYIIPNYLVPFTQTHELKQEILIMDIQEQNWAGNDGDDYKNIISKLQLSEASNPTFGFGRGFVPTIQYYEKGEVKDACVTFNDALAEDGENYKVSSTYYTQERLENLSFLKNSDVENKVLLGLQVPASDTDSRFHMWTHDAASVYHLPILEAFLLAYAL